MPARHTAPGPTRPPLHPPPLPPPEGRRGGHGGHEGSWETAVQPQQQQVLLLVTAVTATARKTRSATRGRRGHGASAREGSGSSSSNHTRCFSPRRLPLPPVLREIKRTKEAAGPFLPLINLPLLHSTRLGRRPRKYFRKESS